MTPEQVASFKEQASLDERYLIDLIGWHLLTRAQREWLFEHDYSLADVLNGRTSDAYALEVQAMFDAWNAKLGEKYFGFGI